LTRAKLAQIAECEAWAQARLPTLAGDAFFAAGVALYAGEGAKADGAVKFANTDPRMIVFFCGWLRHFFAIDEARLRGCIYLHEDLDYASALTFWSSTTAIPAGQFTAPYRAVADPTRRVRRHVNGCMYVNYHCSLTHRKVMAACATLLSFETVYPA
jgi:hypothetical protein